MDFDYYKKVSRMIDTVAGKIGPKYPEKTFDELRDLALKVIYKAAKQIIDEPSYEPQKQQRKTIIQHKQQQPKRRRKIIGGQKQHGGVFPHAPDYMPISLLHTLQVAHLVYKGYGRNTATNEVAKIANVTRNTIQDQYTRRLDIDTGKFDSLLQNKPNLISFLKKQHRVFAGTIDDFLGR